MVELGEWLKDLGLAIIPYSFAFYLPTRWLEYIWRQGYSRFVKAIWYFALGMVYVTGGIEANYVVMYICFIEAIDLCFQQLEVQRKRQNNN